LASTENQQLEGSVIDVVNAEVARNVDRPQRHRKRERSILGACVRVAGRGFIFDFDVVAVSGKARFSNITSPQSRGRGGATAPLPRPALRIEKTYTNVDATGASYPTRGERTSDGPRFEIMGYHRRLKRDPFAEGESHRSHGQ